MKHSNRLIGLAFIVRVCAILSGLVGATGGFSAVAQAAVPRPMNVLFIVSDDLNCQLGCYGNKVVKTPHIDRLASLGVRFDRAYCNYPVCNASRTSFLSGRYPDTTQVFGNGTHPRVALGKEFQFLPEYFHAKGYFTAGIGKISHGTYAGSVQWDVFSDAARGIGDDDGDAPPRRNKGDKKGGKKAAKKAASDTGDVPFGWQATDNKDEDEPDGRTATTVVKLLEEHRDKPFFIAAGFHKPHIPHTAPKKYFDMYPIKEIPLPVEPAGHAKHIPQIAIPGKYYPDLTDAQKRAIIQHYYAATTFMDAQVGRLLEAMDRLKLWDNTVVVFFGDHGWHHGEHDGFWAKVSLMEESARSPLIVAAPGHTPNTVSTRLVEFVDIYPTLTELCALDAPSGIEGTSVVPLLDNPARPWKKGVFSVVTRRGGLGRSVRTEKYTYTLWPDGSEQLYDYIADPKEYVNLVESADHQARLRDLRRQLKSGPAQAKP